jgi:hypothetical protein
MKYDPSVAQAHLMREKENEAIRDQDKSLGVIENYRLQLETNYGYPILVQDLKSKGSFAGRARPYWNQRTDSRTHSIELAPCAPWVRPHRLAHELIHIALECEANVTGKRKTHVQCPAALQQLLAAICADRQSDEAVLNNLFSFTLNVATDLVVEARLRRDFPCLAAPQFIDLHKFEDRNARNHDMSKGWDMSPRLRLAYETLMVLRALSADHLAPGVIKRFERYQNTPAGNLGQLIYGEFQTTFYRGMEPDEHYTLADRVAEFIGLPGLHDWSPLPTFELVQNIAIQEIE